MEYAENVGEQICLEFPKGWKITTTPQAIYNSNRIGRIVTRTEVSENTLKTIRSFYTEQAYWPPGEYAPIRELFQRYDESTDFLYIVKPK